MHTGLALWTDFPLADKRPLVCSTLKGTMVSLSSFSANKRLPSGDNVKKRGVRPCEDSAPRNSRRLVAGSMRNTAILS